MLPIGRILSNLFGKVCITGLSHVHSQEECAVSLALWCTLYDVLANIMHRPNKTFKSAYHSMQCMYNTHYQAYNKANLPCMQYNKLPYNVHYTSPTVNSLVILME